MKQMNNAIEDVNQQIEQLVEKAKSKNLSVREFADEIWLGAIKGKLPELKIALVMFKKALAIPQPEIDKLVQSLIHLTLCGDSEAITRALSLICEGLIAIHTEKQ